MAMSQEFLDAVAKDFVERYYKAFNNSRAELKGLYQATSMFTFEGQRPLVGQDAIARKLESYEACEFKAGPIACQQLGQQGMLICVSGTLRTAPKWNLTKFSEAFYLLPGVGPFVVQGAQGPVSFFVQNDIFQLNDVVLRTGQEKIVERNFEW